MFTWRRLWAQRPALCLIIMFFINYVAGRICSCYDDGKTFSNAAAAGSTAEVLDLGQPKLSARPISARSLGRGLWQR